MVQHESKKIDARTPTGKNELLRSVSQKIHSWNQPVIIHESLKKLALMLNIPDNMLGLDNYHSPNTFIKKSATIVAQDINPDQIIETDFLRWLHVCSKSKPEFAAWAKVNIMPEDMVDPSCKSFIRRIKHLLPRGVSRAGFLSEPYDHRRWTIMV